MADPTDLQALCSEVLLAAAEALDTIPGFAPELEGAPGRAYVSAGEPALDCCDQLTVNAARTVEALTEPLGLGIGDRHRYNFRRNQVGINVYITRCLDVQALQSLPPAPELLEALAEQTNADGWALWNHLWNLATEGELVSLCEQIFFDSLDPLRPSGGCSGWILRMRANLDGYQETLVS